MGLGVGAGVSVDPVSKDGVGDGAGVNAASGVVGVATGVVDVGTQPGVSPTIRAKAIERVAMIAFLDIEALLCLNPLLVEGFKWHAPSRVRHLLLLRAKVGNRIPTRGHLYGALRFALN